MRGTLTPSISTDSTSTFAWPLVPIPRTFTFTSCVPLNNPSSGFEELRPALIWSKSRSEEHTSELQSPCNLVCRLLLEKKKNSKNVIVCSASRYDRLEHSSVLNTRHNA